MSLRKIHIALAVTVLALAGTTIVNSASAGPTAVEYAVILALIP